MSTSHEPAYSEDGMPKDRYRLYHVEKAKGGIALTMIGGSSIVSADSPQAFGNLMASKDEIVPWLRRISDEVHEHGTAIMIQLSHLGRRTNWNTADRSEGRRSGEEWVRTGKSRGSPYSTKKNKDKR